MQTDHISHSLYTEPLFTNRFIKHQHLKTKIEQITSEDGFKVAHLGNSVQGREVYHLTIGKGNTKILLWSQMHGDEPTGTLTFFDLFNFFVADDEHNDIRAHILEACTLHFVPMLNPDGAVVHKRRNAQDIDINRDFLKQQTPEARMLIALQHELKPDFCFNMHDQETLWSVAGSKKPAAISLLAPPADPEGSLTFNRFKAMLVIAGMHQVLVKQIPGNIGRWSDEFEGRAFGDNFQRLGSATILVEGGGYDQDFEKQYVRKLTFDILLNAFVQIAGETYKQKQLKDYYAIPVNSRDLFHLMIKGCKIQVGDNIFTADIGLNYSEAFDLEAGTSIRNYVIADLGDLSTWNAYEFFEANDDMLTAPIHIGDKADFTIKCRDGNVVIFKDGLMVKL